MVSDAGQIIRCPIDQISIIGRSGRGVTIFKVADEERLVSVSRFRDLEDDDEDEIGGRSDGVDIVDVGTENSDVPADESDGTVMNNGAGDAEL